MRKIILQDFQYLGRKDLELYVDEEQVHFVNGIAAVNAIDSIDDENGMKFSGIIDEEYHEVFDDDWKQYGEATRNLMFINYNKNILRCGENDFIVKVIKGDECHTYTVYKHIRIIDNKAIIVNKDIGAYSKTNDENILIINGSYYKKLYNVSKAEYVSNAKHIVEYTDISTIDGCSNCFVAKQIVNSLTKDSSEDEELYLTDNLYFQIDQNGHIISKVFSQRKLDFLDYGDIDIDEYPTYRKQELIEESSKLKENVYSLRRYKK